MLLTLTHSALAALVSLTPAPTVQAAPAAVAVRSEQEQPAPEALKRILHLAGGTSLRAIAKPTGDGWSYKVKGKWRSLPGQAVERVVLERDALRDLKAERKRQPQRTALAEWALESGLLSEGMHELSLAFADAREQAAALEVLERNAQRFAVPRATSSEGVELLIDWATARDRTSRELALIELRAQATPELRERFKRDLSESSIKRRSFAALAMGRLFPGEEYRALIGRAVLDTSIDVRQHASHALGAAQKPELIVPIVRALSSSTERVRLQAAEALGNMAYPAAVAPLVTRLASLQNRSGSGRVPHANIFVGRQFAYIQDFDVEVAANQAVADPQVNVLIEGQVTDAGVSGIKQVAFAAERNVIQKALGALTGEQPGHSSRAWLRWWEQNSGDYSAAQ